MLIPFLMLASGVGPQLTYVTTGTSSNSDKCTIPAEAHAGDLAVLFDRSSGASIPDEVDPSGWTKVRTDTTTGAARSTVFYRVLTAGEPGQEITGMKSNTDKKAILVFRPSRTIISISVGSSNGEGTVDAPAEQTITIAAVDGTELALAHFICKSSDFLGTNFSPSPDATPVDVSGQRVQYKIYNTPSRSNLSIQESDSGSYNILQSFHLKVK
jgi:hypothetical protein